MRIISRFHDYYDCISSTDQDRDTIFHRVMQETSTDQDYRFVNTSTNQYSHDTNLYGGDIELQQIIIGFCGRVYQGFHYTLRRYGVDNIYGYLFNQDSIKELIEKNHKGNKREYWGSSKDQMIQISDRYFQQNINLVHIFKKYNQPIFVIDGCVYTKNNLVINPELRL